MYICLLSRQIRKIILFTAFVILINLCHSQIPNLDWNLSVGGTDFDVGKKVLSDNNNSFIIIGKSASSDGDVEINKGLSDIVVARFDSLNNLLWEKTYGGSQVEDGLSIIPCENNGYLVGGFTYSNDGDVSANYGSFDGLLIKLNIEGNLEWSKNYGGSSSDLITSTVESFDSGYLFTGNSFSNDFDIIDHIGDVDNSDLIIGKTDTLGNLLWIKSYGGEYWDGGNQIIRTHDSCYLVCGYLNYFDASYYIIKINESGELLWEKTFGGSGFDQAWSIFETESGNIVVSGEAWSDDGDVVGQHGSSDNWILFLDSLGNLLWQIPLGGDRSRKWVSNFRNFGRILTCCRFNYFS